MPIQAKITHLPLESIVLDRENRQRTDITNESVLDLAISIGQSQWISPLLVETETNKLMAGERRLTAVKLLCSVYNGTTKGELAEALKDVSDCKQPAWDHWNKIPVQLGSNLKPLELMVFEFIENKERLDLPWQDKAKAIYQIHEACCLQSSTRWHNSDTAKLLGLHPTVVGKYLQIGRTSQSTDPKLIHVIKESETLNSAVAAIDRVNTRSNPASKLGLGKVYTPPIEPTTDYEEDLEPVSLGAQSILHADFHKWAADYTGAPFNFIHCDFPYGISYNTGGNFSAPADTVQMGQYDDSAEVYWELLDTLRRHEEQLIADSCHIMFWFSQSYAKGETDYRKNMRRLTEDYFLDSFPAAKLQSFPMIWNHSQLQTTPDHNRYGARTYETAMLLTFGDRKIVKPVHLCCEYNTPSGAKIHRSQKPIPVLRHFFSMFVDDTTTMLDPTCGSGSSVITAHQLGAQKILGIEQDEPTYKTAIKYFEEQT